MQNDAFPSVCVEMVALNLESGIVKLKLGFSIQNRLVVIKDYVHVR